MMYPKIVEFSDMQAPVVQDWARSLKAINLGGELIK